MRKKIRCFNLVNEIKDFEFNNFEEFENWVDNGAKFDDNQSFTPENLENILNKIKLIIQNFLRNSELSILFSSKYFLE